MDSTRLYTREELKEAALHDLITSRVDSRMISYLAKAADNVIPCDKNMMPAQSRKNTSPANLPTPPPLPSSAPSSQDPMLPTVEQFIRQLVRSSNVQAATLMPTLVYLQRLKNKLNPCPEYVNDISPKNKHWARYTNMEGPTYHFGFCTSEVNLMEKQLLQLLDFDLRFSEEDLYNSWREYVEPTRQKMEDENRKTYFAWQETAMRAAATPSILPATTRSMITTTPTSVDSVDYTDIYTPSQYAGYEYPTVAANKGQRKRLLPYEITAEQAMAHSMENRTAKIPVQAGESSAGSLAVL
ncbi:unnamed protein product [Parascedosporium putredinis]|uniref:Uncharacterized protein n=1 Tax=Parascedosporium putredinis TaxID=1442378 RepID=A0A9P1MC53_9PEZI|nr:unnamed protein product [Parascedosporium putredinis]CAI7999978.1 unnamed protein product [Parascedosporium putredinis]